jgi:hypothetical protein
MRIRVPAGSSNERLGALTTDAVSNFVARLGISSPNLLANTSYSFTPISRLQQLMEWAYRGSWVVGAAVDVIAEDMTREGVQMNSDTPPDDIEALHTAENEICLWQSLSDTIKWARLYGGALMVYMIDGQDPATPLREEAVPRDGLKGFMVIDRWMVQPTFSELVTEPGPEYGMPVYYDLIATAPYMPRQRIHYSRVLRQDGVTLPFRQRIAENGWGMSVIERLYDRLIAFDSGTMGAAQLLYKAYIRTYKVNGYRALIGAGGEFIEKFMKTMELMRLMQSNEGMTVIDKDDEFETHAYTFAGIPDVLLMLGQQLSGALGIPLVRLFGQSPAGLSATGESDWRLYESMIGAQQQARVSRPLTRVYRIMWRSVLGKAPPPEWNFTFRNIRPLTEMEKAEIAQRDADTIKLLHDAAIISTTIALKELKQNSILTGRFTNITTEDIEDSEEAPPPWEQPEPGMPGAPGQPGVPPGQPGAAPGAAEGEGGGDTGGTSVRLGSSAQGGEGEGKGETADGKPNGKLNGSGAAT